MKHKTQTVDDDLYNSITPEQRIGSGRVKILKEEKPTIEEEPKFRKVPQRFVISYTPPHKDLGMEEYVLMKEKEKFFLKVIFVALILTAYGLI